MLRRLQSRYRWNRYADMAGIFISYRQEDAKPWALLLNRELTEVFGAERVFLDKDTLRAGSWRAQIHEALDQCRVVLVVIGRQWLTLADEKGLRRLDHPDDVHRQEIAMALSRSEVIVIPVRVDGVPMPRGDELPADIRSLADQQSRELSDNSARRLVDMQALFDDIQRITGLERRDLRTRETGRRFHPYGALMAGLKRWCNTLVAAIVLSLAVWAFFFVVTPGQPLTPAETSIVLGASTVLVLAIKRIWSAMRKSRLQE